LGFMQGIEPKRIADAVRVVAPPGMEPSTLVGASGIHYLAKIEGTDRVFYLSKADARCILGNHIASNLSWISSNQPLKSQLGSIPAAPPGVRVADLLQAARDAAPRDPRDVGGMARDTLGAMSMLRDE
jgi:hypothetical protein